LPIGAEQQVFIAERESFVSALLHLVKNRSLLEEKAAAAREFVRQNCTWEDKLQALDALLEKVTAQKHGQ
jgi:hypothetical protein